MLSSNLCKYYFSAFVKVDEGKRMSTDTSDNWIILQHFVAGLRSNVEFRSMLLNEIGTCANEMRNEKMGH